MTAVDLGRVSDQVSWHLEEIRKLFRDPKLTLVVRTPSVPDGEFILTDDELAKVVATLDKHRDADR